MQQPMDFTTNVSGPKVVIITMFGLETEAWLGHEFPKFEVQICIAGLHPKYPKIWSTKDEDIVLLTTGESLLNAALSLCALINSSRFDLRQSYFVVAGIAGVNPKVGTLGSVSLARYAVQVDLQYEVDASEVPDSWMTGYIPQGASNPWEFPKTIYGTEMYELNNNLRQRMIISASEVPLADSNAAVDYRQQFADAGNDAFRKATVRPSVIDGDVASSNVFFHGHQLAERTETVFELLTHGRGSYCMTAQEDNAILGALSRAASQGCVDFARILIMRAGSNFDRPINCLRRPKFPLHSAHGGLEPALENLRRVGHVIVGDIVRQWESTFKQGIKPTNYIGDIFGFLDDTPDSGVSNGTPR